MSSGVFLLHPPACPPGPPDLCSRSLTTWSHPCSKLGTPLYAPLETALFILENSPFLFPLAPRTRTSQPSAFSSFPAWPYVPPDGSVIGRESLFGSLPSLGIVGWKSLSSLIVPSGLASLFFASSSQAVQYSCLCGLRRSFSAFHGTSLQSFTVSLMRPS